MPKPTVAVSDAIMAAMAETNQLFNNEVFLRKNFDALDRIYTKNAKILPPGSELVEGRKGIKDFWSQLIQSVNAKSAVLTSVEVVPSSEGILEIGKAALTVAPDGEPVQVDVKYVVYWQQEDGVWKWHVDIWNMNA